MAKPEKVNRAALEGALMALYDHRKVLKAALVDLGLPEKAAVNVRDAIVHVVEDEFRSDEDRGGS